MDGAQPTRTRKPESVRVELRGVLRDKVQIAKLFRSAYEVLDRLSTGSVARIEVVYGEDFCVDEALSEEFTHAAQEALAYQNALTFGRSIDSLVIGLSKIQDSHTRALVQGIHQSQQSARRGR